MGAEAYLSQANHGAITLVMRVGTAMSPGSGACLTKFAQPVSR